jgi:hypothetical protein
MKQTHILANVATERGHEIPEHVRSAVLANKTQLKVAVTALVVSVGLQQPDAVTGEVTLHLGDSGPQVFVSKADPEEHLVGVYTGLVDGQINPSALEVNWLGHTAWVKLHLDLRADLESSQILVSVRQLGVIALATMGTRVEVASQEGVALLAIFGNMKIRSCSINVSEY